jgi:hypothetical protein
MKPSYTLDKIKFGVDNSTFNRAVGLYEQGKVTNFEDNLSGYSAVVLGTYSYNVSVSASHYNFGDCDCYLGQRGELCKHMIAVAIYAILRGKKMSKQDKKVIDTLESSGKVGKLNDIELAELKRTITSAMKYIKAYTGPSRTWFAYQNSLDEGCARLTKVASELPVSEQTAKILVDMILRLDKKLCTSGIDDSNGTVGGFIEDVVLVLIEYTKLDSECIKAFKKLCGIETCFGWEKPLVVMFDNFSTDKK